MDKHSEDGASKQLQQGKDELDLRKEQRSPFIEALSTRTQALIQQARMKKHQGQAREALVLLSNATPETPEADMLPEQSKIENAYTQVRRELDLPEEKGLKKIESDRQQDRHERTEEFLGTKALDRS